MAKYVLAVYDECQVYLERFLYYAGSRNNLSFTVKGYTDLTILADDMQNNRIDAVLFSVDDSLLEPAKTEEELLTQFSMDEMIVLILGERHSTGKSQKDQEQGGFDEIITIEKYQPVSNIFREIDEILRSRKGKRESGSDWFYYLKGLYSPMDKVTHPEAAAFLKEDMERVLYVNLEPFSGVNALAQMPAVSDLSDAIYYYKTSPGQLAEILERIKGRLNGMDYLSCPANMDDLEVLDGEDWPGFLRALSKAGDYQLIIIDSCSFSRKLFDVILTYGSLYIPALPYDTSRTYRSVLTAGAAGEELRRMRMAARMREFRQYFEDSDLSRYRDNILEVQLEAD